MPSTVKRHNIKRIEFNDRERLRLAYGAELKFIDTRPYHHIWGFIGLVRIDMREEARRAYGVAADVFQKSRLTASRDRNGGAR